MCTFKLLNSQVSALVVNDKIMDLQLPMILILCTLQIYQDCAVLREDKQASRPYTAIGVIRSGGASVTTLWIKSKID